MTTSIPRGHPASLHERALLDAAQRGDRRAQEELLRRYEPLVRGVCGHLQMPIGCERADIAQEARLGLLTAIRTWRPGRASFRGFASLCIRRHALKALDVAGGRKHRLLSCAGRELGFLRSVGDIATWTYTGRKKSRLPTGSDVDGTYVPYYAKLAPTSSFADPAMILQGRARLDVLLSTMPGLTERERTILRGQINGKSTQQLASEEGSTVKAVTNVLRRARDKLAAADMHTVQPVAPPGHRP